MLQWRVKELLIEKGHAHPTTWLLKRRIGHSLVNKIMHNEQKRVDLTHLNTICEDAYCTPNDLFTWTPEVPAQFKDSHPLQAMRARTIVNINQKLKSMTPAQILELHKIMEGM